MSKHREENFLFPCSDEKQTEYIKLLDKAKFKYTKAPMYRSVPRDLSHIKLEDYDIVALFSPIGVRSLIQGSGQKSLLGKLETAFPGVFARERMVTAFDVTHGKPDPEPYLKAWEGSGLSKEQCCVVENAPLGVRAGKAAGLYVIAVNTGILPDEMLIAEGADKVFKNMEALFEWLKATG